MNNAHTSTKGKLSLGLELGGGKSARTSLVVLKYFPSEKRVFLSEVQSQIQGSRTESGDEALLRLLDGYDNIHSIAVHAPLSLSPCLQCQLPQCPRFENCNVASVAWMREEARRLKLTAQKSPTPYTQRPVEMYIRSRVQKDLPIDVPLEESLGSGMAPLAARMQYLKRHIRAENFYEVFPKISLVAMAAWFGITNRELRRYRDVEDGVENRMMILERLSIGAKVENVPELFLYNTDLVLLAKDIDAFDAFIAALMPIYAQCSLLREFDKDYESTWGVVAIPASFKGNSAKILGQRTL